MKATPPNGVTAPSTRTPVTARTYRLPENNTIPAVNSREIPRAAGRDSCGNADTASNPKAWKKWYCTAFSQIPME